jgi:hypothetical protein
METETALAVVEKQDVLAINRAPDLVLDEARKAAVALTNVIEGKKKKVVFNGNTYLQFEDWQTLGRFYGVTALCVSTKFVEYGEGDEKAKGFEAKADALLVGTNQVISSAEALCLNDEKNWSTKPLFQLKSMAQTRACAKVLRNVLAWVVVLAGYSPTPAEEMTGDENGQYVQSPRSKSGRQVLESAPIPDTKEVEALFGETQSVEDRVAQASTPRFNGETKGKTITDKQQKRLYALSKQHNWAVEDIKVLIARHGFERSSEITMNAYTAICAEIERVA